MEKIIIEPRYKDLSEEIINSYNDSLDSSKEIETYFSREYPGFTNAKKLTGGRISGVYQLADPTPKRVIKSSEGIYRMMELQREGEVLYFIKDTELNHLVPNIRDFRSFDNFAYVLLDYFDGETLREILKRTRHRDDRCKNWEVVGQTLWKIHSLLTSKDGNGKWLTEQLRLANINMKKGFIDPEDFSGEDPKEVLRWLRANRPKRDEISLLHGDFRTKNIMIDQNKNCKIIDWGFTDVGDPYYDLGIIDYYFKDDFERKSFYKGYGSRAYDKGLIDYYDRLSWFINV